MAQEQPCDENFRLVHEVGPGHLDAIDLSDPGEGWAVGSDTEQGVNERPLAVRFDESGFERMILPHPATRGVRLSAVESISPTDAYAVGVRFGARHSRNVVYHWDGVAWTQFDTPTPGNRSALRGVFAFGPSDVWVVGYWLKSRGRPIEPLVMRFDGTTWTQIRVPSPWKKRKDAGFNDIDASSSRRIWATGFVGNDPLGMVFKNGWRRVWFRSGFHHTEGAFTAVDTVSPQETWLVGGEDGGKSFIAYGRPGNWMFPEPPRLRGSKAISDVAAGTTHAWIVGAHYPRRGPSEHPLALFWSGGKWQVVGFERDSDTYGEIEAVALDPEGTAWAVGSSVVPDPSDPIETEVIQRACTS